MLQIDKRPSLGGRGSPGTDKQVISIILDSVRIIRRQLPIVAVIFLCCLALGAAYLFTTPPSFTATGTLVIDTRKVQLFQQQSVLGDIELDAATVQTQVEVLKSENISLAVIRKLNLADDPEFVPLSGGILSAVTGLFSKPEELTQFERERIALAKFDQSRSVSRVGLTYVMEVTFRSRDPERAAQIVNTLADTYINDQLDAKYQATRRASVWLQERIKDLRTQATAAERAVVDFKEKNNIIDAGGRLMNDQQLAEVNSQLILARAATAETKARLDRIQAVMSQDVPDASVADALNSQVIIKLRQQYLELAQREAIWAQHYGENHLATINLRNQMQELRHSIQDEMRKIAETYKSDYQIAQTREDSINKSLANVVSESQSTGQAQIQLRDLESNAETSRALYDNFLQRYMEAVQQQSFPISEARLISPATKPLQKSAPRGSIVALISLFGGALFGFAVAYLREMSDQVLRTSGQVEETLQVNCLSMLPALKTSAINGKGRNEPVSAQARVAVRESLLRYVVDSPFSRYAEAIRSLKIAADLNGVLKSHKVIGITSTLPNEGKSTIAANLAHLIADAGGSVVLVDADLRIPSLSRSYWPDGPGLIDVVSGSLSLDAAIMTVPGTSLKFLAAGATSKLPHTNEILASGAMKKLIEFLREKYDYIIVDLSPVAPIVDVRTTGHIIDSYIYAVEWGKTKIDVIERALSDAHGVYDRLLGVVLNKVDTGAQSRYERYHGNHYYRKYYSKYGYVE